MTTRTRMSPEERREQLLDLGTRLFSTHAYEDVWIEEVAEQAGVSRGLLYHYFPNKRSFFAATLRRESERMMEETKPDPSQPLFEQLRRGVETYLDHCESHKTGVRAVFRGAASADPEVQEIIEAGTALQVDRIVSAIEPDGEVAPLLLITIRAWLLFLRTACSEWIDASGVARDEVRDLCIATLVAALLALPPDARPTRLPDLL